MACSITFIHAGKITGEQRGLVPARPGADFQHGGPIIGGIARQQFQRQRALGGRQPRIDAGQFFLRDAVHFVGSRNGGQFVAFRDQCPPRLRRLHQRRQLGIVLGQRHELFGRQRRVAHVVRQGGMAALDLGDALNGQAHLLVFTGQGRILRRQIAEDTEHAASGFRIL